MSTRKTADQWFAEYGESHQHHTNELIHWVCVPVIFFCVLGFIWSLPVPAAWRGAVDWFNWSQPAILLVFLFYLRLSPALSCGMLAFMGLCYFLLSLLYWYAGDAVWQVCLGLFVLAWIGQFIGHKLEGKKPSFLNDVVFLLIGPAWLLSFIYKKAGQKY
ncbi:MAG: DUF962 domain-containing protein [Cephaloticoccus sp.]|nr:DUF962 domain-containing protein [Cephaloticoccus sp.]MCF7759226.1 DUF962 domain-containing protein [Cephaloticoccus sp.]